MEDFKPVRVDAADKSRCQAVGPSGDQCPFQGMRDPTIVPGQSGMSEQDVVFLKYCRMHGSATAKSMKVQAKRLYMVGRYKTKLDRIMDPELGINLDEELAILRMTLEECLEKYTEVELVTMSSHVQSLIRDIANVLVANKKLKSQMGELLDRAAMNKLCDALLVVIVKHVPADKMDAVSIDVAGAIAEAVSNRVNSDA